MFPRRIFEDVAVALLDRAGLVVSVNPEWSALAQVGENEFANAEVGDSYLDACESAGPPDTAGQVVAAIHAALQGELPVPAKMVIPGDLLHPGISIGSRLDDRCECVGAIVVLTRHGHTTPTRYAPPAPRAGQIERTSLLARSAAFRDRPVMIVSAPPGFGKTTFAAQWARRDLRPVAWLALREADNDPVHLLGRLWNALESLEAIDPDFITVLRHPHRSLDPILGRFVDSLESRSPMMLALDDVQVVTGASASGVMSVLVNGIPAGSQLLLVTRQDPGPVIARRRLAAELFEIGASELAFDAVEAAQMLAHSGISADAGEVDVLCQRTEGWPAAVSLAAMYALENGADGLRRFQGSHRYLAEFLIGEVVRNESHELRRFLVETSIVDRVSGALGNAMTGRADSASVLRELADRNLFVIPIDEDRRWYRYHNLFREFLQAELANEAGSASTLLCRAAAWHEGMGHTEECFEYARRAGDFARAGRVVMRDGEALLARGLARTALAWVDRCSDENIESDPHLAIAAGWVAGLSGQLQRASRYLAAAQRHDLSVPAASGASSLMAAMTNLRATLGTSGPTQMLADGRSLIESERPTRNPPMLSGYRLVGTAQLILGDAQAAIATFTEALVLTGDERGANQFLCLGCLALAHSDVGAWSEVARLTKQAQSESEVYGSGVETVPLAVAQATLAAHGQHRAEALSALTRAIDSTLIARSMPCFQAEMLMRCCVLAHELGVTPVAQGLAREIRQVCTRFDDAAPILERLGRLESAMAQADSVLATLTPAERRVLGELATHRTLKEIAERLYVSRATVKTHVSAIYTKLGVGSRAEAVALLGSERVPS